MLVAKNCGMTWGKFMGTALANALIFGTDDVYGESVISILF